MTTDGPGILQGSFQFSLICDILDKCKLDLNKFLRFENDPKKNILTKDLFENNLTKILNLINKFKGTLFYLCDKRIAYQVLGYFILLTGANIEENLKEDIISASKFEYEQEDWPEFWKEDRKFYLNELKENMIKHKPGRTYFITH